MTTCIINSGIILASRLVKQEDTSTSKTAALAAGALLGALLATSGIVSLPGGGLPPNAVVRVNGETISKTEYVNLLAVLARDKRNPVTAEDREKLLQRMVEEKLLIARGLEIGLPGSDPGISKAIINAMIQIVLNEVGSEEPGEAELAAFYDANRSYFARPLRLHLQRMVFRGVDAKRRAGEAYNRLHTEDWHRVADELADEDLLSLPRAMLPTSALRGYLGASLTETALELEPGAISSPQQSAAQFSILHLLEREIGSSPPLAEIREQVSHEFQRRAGDQALRDFLDQLRAEATVEIDSAFLEKLDDRDAPPG